MINTLLYYKPYILKHSRIYPPDYNQEGRSAVINLIEPIYSNYKPMEAYNLDISLPFIPSKALDALYLVESTSTYLPGFPLFL